MNFRNKSLNEVFEERYQANHNKELQEAAKNNKKNTIDRMFGKNDISSTPSHTNIQNNPIGYNPTGFNYNMKKW